jgi:hypothetical protein
MSVTFWLWEQDWFLTVCNLTRLIFYNFSCCVNLAKTISPSMFPRRLNGVDRSKIAFDWSKWDCRRDRRVSWNVILSPVLNLFLMSLLIWLNSVVQVLVGSWFSIASFWWRRWGPWGLRGLYWILISILCIGDLNIADRRKWLKICIWTGASTDIVSRARKL